MLTRLISLLSKFLFEKEFNLKGFSVLQLENKKAAQLMDNECRSPRSNHRKQNRFIPVSKFQELSWLLFKC